MIKFRTMIFVLTGLIIHQTEAQNNKVSFSGLGRAMFENDKLGKKDTLNNDRVNSGYMLTDLGFDIKPNSTTEIQAMMRLRNEYGGFYGQGASLLFRQLYIKGLIANRIKYQFGDINLSLTPYTFYNSDGDGNVNEAAAIKMLRNVNEYDNFNFGNTWRQQGGQAEFYLKMPALVQAVKFNTFITRNRAAINTLSELLYGGGSIVINQGKNLILGGNYVNMFTLGKSSNLDERMYNPVVTGNFDLHTSNNVLYLKGESGFSSLYNKNNPNFTVNKSDYFFDVAIGTQTTSKRTGVQLSYKDVGPDFYSAGAQSKRINFNNNPALFPRVANTDDTRAIGLYDLTRDLNLYNRIIAVQLMNYDVRLSNALPYGAATPNRRGANLSMRYKDSLELISVQADIYGLQEIRGEGTSNLRNFFLSRIKADVNINRLLRWNKVIKLTGGYQFENTSRKGDTVSSVALTSHLIDCGVEVEIFEKFDVLAGAKFLMSKGNEYIAARDLYNTIIDYTSLKINSLETLWGGGVRYRFSPTIFLSVQGHLFDMKNTAMANTDYTFSQIFILYNMKF